MNLFKALGFIIGWVAPFGVIYVNHVYLADAGFDVDMFGLIFIIVLVFGVLKLLDRKTKVWEIQNIHKMFRLNWSNGKKVVLVLILTLGLYTIEDNLPKMQWSAVLISFCFIVGWVFSMIGNIKEYKKKRTI